MEINFGESLKELIHNNKMTAEELAIKLNFSRSTIYSWISNKTDIRLTKLLKVANFFDCSIEFLIGRDYSNSPNMIKNCPPFAKRLREVMDEKGLTTYKLIQTTHYSSKHLYNWAHGTDPLLATLVQLSNILDCTIDYLVGRQK